MRFVDGQKSINGFQFHDQLSANDKINLSLPYLPSFVIDRHRIRSLVRNRLDVELQSKGLFVNTFKISRPQMPMDFNCRPDSQTGERVYIKSWLILGAVNDPRLKARASNYGSSR